MPALAVELCLLMLCGAAVALNTIDTFKPIARLSPARGADTDEFGYSVAAHKLSSTATGFTNTLANTVVIVGAPLGRYPGGLDLPLNSSVCELYDLARNVTRDITMLTDEEIRECYLRTGLVYTCPLTGTGGCGPLLGNMDARGADGALFDRVGNIMQTINPDLSDAKAIQQNKTQQRMGNTLFSSGEFFVACAPFWLNTRGMTKNASPVGVCAFSGQTLENFQYTETCRPAGRGTNSNGEEICMTGQSAAIRKGAQLSDSALGITTPGRFRFRGGVYYYNNLTSLEPMSTDVSDQELGQTRTFTVGALESGSMQNVPGQINSIYGFATAVGRFNGTGSSEFFYVSSPQFKDSNMNAIGRVYVVTDFEAIPIVTVDGEQFGEYFGFSIAAPDLNGDGYDDMVVGAPMYSDTDNILPELGRIFILYNNAGQSFTRNQTVVGSVALGRFGHSVTSLGDLNNDGCDDIAVSAPFNEGGKVFIYYGSKETGINSTVQQTITAEQMTKQVTNLTSSGGITGFGFSLDGKVDVDDNQYRDLVVSAIGNSSTNGQAVFVLRSLPVATVSLNITGFPAEVMRENKNCEANGAMTACFNISLCGTFTGKGLPNINPKFRLQENIVGTRSRVFFDPLNNINNVITDTFNISSAGQEVCKEIAVYVRSDITPDQVAPMSFTFSLLPFERSQSPVDTNFQPDDLVTLPVIKSSPYTTTVPFALNCGDDDICTSDLMLKLVGVTYLFNRTAVQNDALTAGGVDEIMISLEFSNIDEDAFRPVLSFDLPPAVFFNPVIRGLSSTSSCIGTRVNGSDSFTCNGFPNPLQQSAMTTQIQLTWQVSLTDIRGDEGSFTIPIQFKVNDGVSFNRENISTLSNNNVTVTIPVNARTTVNVQTPQETLFYFGNLSSTVFTNQFPRYTLQYSFRNQGPSNIFNSTATILLPFQVPTQQNRYYLYPYNITVSDTVSCDITGVINPDNIQGLENRRRRSADNVRPARQATTGSALSCVTSPERCEQLVCRIARLTTSRPAVVTLSVVTDERFFFNMGSAFTLVTSASIQVHDRFIDIKGTLSNNGTIQLTKPPQRAQEIPIYVYIIPIVVAPLLIIALGIVLYFCGCFRRKKQDGKGEETQKEDFEAFDENPFNQPKLTALTHTGDKSEKEVDEK